MTSVSNGGQHPVSVSSAEACNGNMMTGTVEDGNKILRVSSVLSIAREIVGREQAREETIPRVEKNVGNSGGDGSLYSPRCFHEILLHTKSEKSFGTVRLKWACAHRQTLVQDRGGHQRGLEEVYRRLPS